MYVDMWLWFAYVLPSPMLTCGTTLDILLLYVDMGWQIHLDIIVIKKKMYLNIIYQNGKAATTYAILNLHAS